MLIWLTKTFYLGYICLQMHKQINSIEPITNTR